MLLMLCVSFSAFAQRDFNAKKKDGKVVITDVEEEIPVDTSAAVQQVRTIAYTAFANLGTRIVESYKNEKEGLNAARLYEMLADSSYFDDMKATFTDQVTGDYKLNFNGAVHDASITSDMKLIIGAKKMDIEIYSRNLFKATDFMIIGAPGLKEHIFFAMEPLGNGSVRWLGVTSTGKLITIQ